jgi:hypothetical protein
MATKKVDFSADTFKIILMQSGFTYNKDTHEDYGDVSASELATASGYTAGGNTLGGVAVTEDDTNDECSITWNNTSWIASGGNIVASGAIIFDDTVATPADPIVGYIDFGTDQTTLDGGTFTLTNIEVVIQNIDS